MCVSPETPETIQATTESANHFLSLENRGFRNGEKINIMINRHQATMLNVRERHLQLAVTSRKVSKKRV